MKFRSLTSYLTIILFVCLLANSVLGQTLLDSIQIPLKTHVRPQDSIIFDSKSKGTNTLGLLDSLQSTLDQNNPVNTSNHNLDSIKKGFHEQVDSLRFTYKHNVSKLDTLKSSLRKELDNLTRRNLPTNDVAEKFDSVARLQHHLTAGFETTLQEIKDRASSRISNMNLPPELAEKAKAITGNINSEAFRNSILKKPGLDGFNSPLDNLNSIGQLQNTPDLDLSGIPTDVGNVEIPPGLSGAGNLTKPTLPTGNLGDVESLSKIAEEKATEISGIKEIEKQTESLDQYKEMATQPPDQDSLKQIAIAQLRQVAVNHFAGKEQVLQEAMETMTKYKKKYISVSSISELPKKRPNEMKGKPFIERIIPGLALQIQKEGEDFMVDFNAYAAYRITRKVNAGVGWNQRVAYNLKYNGFNSNLRIFGPRVFGEYNLWKGFSPRAEMELMNTNLPRVTRGVSSDPLQREWVWGAFVGLKKEYRIIKNIKGTAMVMTRLFNPDNKSPYADVLNVRFGFEFPVRKKVKVADPATTSSL